MHFLLTCESVYSLAFAKSLKPGLATQVINHMYHIYDIYTAVDSRTKLCCSRFGNRELSYKTLSRQNTKSFEYTLFHY
jgi:hypothetical protein